MLERVDRTAAGEDIPVETAILRSINIVEIAAQGMVLLLPSYVDCTLN
jgi:hypothetical protein